MSGRNGRSWDLGSPSKRTWPLAKAASGGRKRITVPALPTSTDAGPVSLPGPIFRSLFSSLVMVVPKACKPAIINSESLECSGLRSSDGLLAWAAKIKARFVTDLEPGITTVAETGSSPRKGALQSSVMALSLPPGSRSPPLDL